MTVQKKHDEKDGRSLRELLSFDIVRLVQRFGIVPHCRSLEVLLSCTSFDMYRPLNTIARVCFIIGYVTRGNKLLVVIANTTEHSIG